jgi:hypothetical protein
MNYERIYNQIIERSKNELEQRIEHKKNGGYYEGHHIIPRCMGGKGRSNQWYIKNKHTNIVPLTAKEHYICHRLLCEIYPTNNKLKYALWAISTGCGGTIGMRYKVSGNTYNKIRIDVMNTKRGKSYTELYGENKAKELILKKKEWLKLNHPFKGVYGDNHPRYGHTHSDEWKQLQSDRVSGTNNPMYGYIFSEEQLCKKSENQSGTNNSFYGKTHSIEVRTKISNYMKSREKLICEHCSRSIDPHNYKRWHGDRCTKNFSK